MPTHASPRATSWPRDESDVFESWALARISPASFLVSSTSIRWRPTVLEISEEIHQSERLEVGSLFGEPIVRVGLKTCLPALLEVGQAAELRLATPADAAFGAARDDADVLRL